MSPSIAQNGLLPNDLVVGTPEWDKVQREHDEAVVRVARLRHLQSKLPLDILDAEVRVRDLAGRLGLDTPPVPRALVAARPGDDGLTDRQRQALDALPGYAPDIASAVGVTTANVWPILNALRRKGLATKAEGRIALWSRVGDDPPPEPPDEPPVEEVSTSAPPEPSCPPGVTVKQWAVLRLLPATARKVAGELGVERSVVSLRLNALKGRGLVVPPASPGGEWARP